MRISARVTRDIQRDVRISILEMQNSIVKAAKEATVGLKNDLRAQMVAAGLGNRVSKTWRGKFYQNEKLNAAAFVWSKVPLIVEVFDSGATIKGVRKRFLAIPTKAVPRGQGNKRLTPENWPEWKYGKLQFVKRPGKNAVLVATGVRIGKTGRVGRRLANPRLSSGRLKTGVTSVVMFTLIKRVKIKKRLDVKKLAVKWSGKMVEMIRTG